MFWDLGFLIKMMIMQSGAYLLVMSPAISINLWHTCPVLDLGWGYHSLAANETHVEDVGEGGEGYQKLTSFFMWRSVGPGKQMFACYLLHPIAGGTLLGASRGWWGAGRWQPLFLMTAPVCGWQHAASKAAAHPNVSYLVLEWWLSHCKCVCAKLLQSCPTLCDPMDCSLPGSPVHGILQARILEWVAMSSSSGSSWPVDWTCVSYVSCIGRRVLYH